MGFLVEATDGLHQGYIFTENMMLTWIITSVIKVKVIGLNIFKLKSLFVSPLCGIVAPLFPHSGLPLVKVLLGILER